MRKTPISVVLPCFNEGGTILKNLKKIHFYLSSNFETFEIIAVNDGSIDSTLSEIKKASELFELTIVNQPKNYGKGKAVRDGILASHHEIVMFLDADLAIPIESLSIFLDSLEKGADIAIASRFVPGLKVLKPVLWYRKFMEHVFRLLRIMIINNSGIRDTQCGFKVFKRKAAMTIFPLMTVNRFAFDSEIIFVARKMGFSVRELPISLQNPTQSHVRIIRDSLNMINDLLKIRLNDLQGRYDLK